MQRFSDQLLRYSKRVVRREKLILLNAPPEIIVKEEELISKAIKEFSAVDQGMANLAVEVELIKEVVSSLSSPACWNCLGNKGIGDCNIAKVQQNFAAELRAAKNPFEEEKAVTKFNDTFDEHLIPENAHLECGEYQLNDEMFNAQIDKCTPLIEAVASKYGVRKAFVESEVNKMVIKFVDEVFPTSSGTPH